MGTGTDIIASGVAMGVIHVLTGPDHLSALATLSANVGNCQAVSYGVRWGIGHSTGLLIVGVAMIALSSGDEVTISPTLETALETLVGIFMLLLGTYGLGKAMRKRRSRQNSSGNDETHMYSVTDGVDDSDDPEYGSSPQHFAESGSGLALTKSVTTGEPSVEDPNEKTADGHSEIEAASLSRWQTTLLSCFCPFAVCGTLKKRVAEGRISSQVVALCVGLVHGVAGPGGVLGVIPAVKLHDSKLATLYLSTFCITSTLTMGAFAGTYGTCSNRLSSYSSQLEYQIEFFSAFLSILVGIIWLTLLSTGKLHDVFP
mmetsp:Transcript_6865/g.12326  ORF Transcript_6865/g.12326 Transcript_6865/m.12326 type:complete len:315 (-) Transcript_6865:1633-2577(-)